MEATSPNNGEPQSTNPGEIDFGGLLDPLNDVRANLNVNAAEPATPAPEAPQPPEATPPAPAVPQLPNAFSPNVPRASMLATDPSAIPRITSLGQQGATGSMPHVSVPRLAVPTTPWVPRSIPLEPETPPTPAPEAPQPPEATPPAPAVAPLPPTPESTPSTSEHSRVAASAVMVETNRPTANTDGADRIWVDNHSADTGSYQGLGRADFVRESLVAHAATKVTSTGAVLVEGTSQATSGRLTKAVIGDYIAPEPADQDSRSPKDKMKTAIEDVRARSGNVAASTNADTSFLAVEVVDEKVVIGASGSVTLLTASIGDPQKRVRYMPGIAPQGTREQPENGLFMPDTQKAAGDIIAETRIKRPVRFIGASASFDLDSVRKHRPQAFAEAFHQDTPDAAADAIRKIARDIYGDDPEHWDDRALFVLDVEPGTASPPTPVAALAPVSTPAPAPVAPPMPAASPVAPAHRPVLVTSTPSRILDQTALRARVLLQDLAHETGSDDGNPDQELIDAVEKAYKEAFDNYVQSLAKRSDSSFALNGARHNAASSEFGRVLEARQAVGALVLDRHLEQTNPYMTEDERDNEIRARLVQSMLGGEVPSMSDPNVSITVGGTIADIGDAVYKQRLENAGWTLDSYGNVVAAPQEGMRKYAAKFVEKWAEWGTQGVRGFAKRSAAMASGGVAVAAVTAVTAGAAGIAVGSGASLLSAGGAIAAATRASRALIGTRLHKQSDLISQSRHDNNDLITRVSLGYDANGNNESVIGQFDLNAQESKGRNARRAAILGATTLASSVAGEFVGYFFNHADTVSGHASAQGTGHPTTAPTSRPSAAPSNHPTTSPSTSPSASATQSPSASPSPSTSGSVETPSASPSHPAPTQTAPSTSPTTGGNASHAPGNGTGTSTPEPGNGTGAGNGGETTPGTGGAPDAVELKVGHGQTVSDVLSTAKGGSFSENWQTMLDSAKSAQAAGQLRVVHLQNGNFYYQSMVNGHWTDNTTDVVKTLSKFSKGKFALAA